ncbi:MAG TPA: hypothetical protein VG247_07810 [Pseudonocardiaceae bacterium]|jgi:hypothetical protein|nr:hypothetical protein [Pseudonocardiaceae bacterium]
MNGEPPVRIGLRVPGRRNGRWGERYVEAEDPFGYAWTFFDVTGG